MAEIAVKEKKVPQKIANIAKFLCFSTFLESNSVTCSSVKRVSGEIPSLTLVSKTTLESALTANWSRRTHSVYNPEIKQT